MTDTPESFAGAYGRQVCGHLARFRVDSGAAHYCLACEHAAAVEEVKRLRAALLLIAGAVYPTYTMYGATVVFVDAGVVENLKAIAEGAIHD